MVPYWLLIPTFLVPLVAGYAYGSWRGWARGADWAANQGILDFAGTLPRDQVYVIKRDDD